MTHVVLEEQSLLCLFFSFLSFWCISMVLSPFPPLYISAVPDLHTTLLYTHTLLFLPIVPLITSTCSMVHWITVNPIRGCPSAPHNPSPATLPGTNPSEGQSGCAPPHRHPSLIPASAQCYSRGPSWGTAKARSLSDDG